MSCRGRWDASMVRDSLSIGEEQGGASIDIWRRGPCDFTRTRGKNEASSVCVRRAKEVFLQCRLAPPALSYSKSSLSRPPLISTKYAVPNRTNCAICSNENSSDTSIRSPVVWMWPVFESSKVASMPKAEGTPMDVQEEWSEQASMWSG